MVHTLSLQNQAISIYGSLQMLQKENQSRLHYNNNSM